MDDSADEFLNYIVQGAKRMEALVRDILTYTHVSQAELQGGTSATEASSVLNNVITGMEQAIIDAGARIEADPLPVLAVRDVHLERLFQNLLSNALKYRSERAPRIRVSAAPDSSPGCWQLSVSDNGIGINPRYHEQVFALFRRLHSSAEYEGTGIGLAICQKIVERYGGKIWVESPGSGGTTFHFSLPGVQR
jgi:light-regulated signal transduction histidine kinase (bacteriophytochrome)